MSSLASSLVDTSNITVKTDIAAVQCVLDRRIVNADTLPDMDNLGLSFLATLCGRNRGAFVVQGQAATYGCTALPPDFGTRAGVKLAKHQELPDANSLVQGYPAGNLTAAQTVDLLDYLNQVVYTSTGPGVAGDAYACNTAGLAQLTCPNKNKAPTETIRAVTTAGLFVPVSWVSSTPLTPEERQAFYTEHDFAKMAKEGLNTVQIPFPLEAFSSTAPEDEDLVSHLKTVVKWAQQSGLQVIVELDSKGKPDEDAVTAAASFAEKRFLWGLTLPSKDTIKTARTAAPDLTLLVPVHQGQLATLDFGDDPKVYGALDLSHTSGVGNVASSSSAEDRSKLFFHENMACLWRSPLEFTQCYRSIPLLVAKGFDLAIDDCIHQNVDDGVAFVDYGQCDRLDETVDSHWWQRHRQSLAKRQMFAYEQGLGWSFAAWKLFGEKDSVGELDDFAKLFSFQDVSAAGLLPSLLKVDEEDLALACLNPPTADFVMGDTTLSPTPAPVDCGNGWWNETIQGCTYWVPPVTQAPTPAPTITCPDVEQCQITYSNSMLPAAGGTLVGLIVGLLIGSKFWNRGREGYTEIPSAAGGDNKV